MKSKIVSLARHRRLARHRLSGRRVHREQLVSGQVIAFPIERTNQRGPRGRGDALACLPLLDGPSVLTEISGHRCQRLPLVKHVIDLSHSGECAPDELSGQVPPMIPMTAKRPPRTISPMGRASTPARFRSEMAKRLTSARIVAGYSTKKLAADALGITLDRYEKWESGRTPVPAQYVGPVCALFHIDANYLFGIEAPAAVGRRTA
jgi:hypothetical protein